MRRRRGSCVLLALPFGRPLGAFLAAGIIFSLATIPAACAQIGPNSDPLARAQTPQHMPLAQIPSFAPLVQKVLPAVVNVSAIEKSGTPLGEDEGEDTNPGEGLPSLPSPFDELLRRFLEQQLIPHFSLQRTALGSGFVIDPAGYIVTSDHVVANADKITVILQDNTRQPARIVGRDAMTDLALLKIDVEHPLPSVAWGDSDAAQVGDWVVAVGNPFGLGGTVSSGIISARGRDIRSGPYDDFLQIDASINRGNSGGPAFNLDGQVIGITTAIYTPSGGSVGIAFAIPSSLARPVIEQLRARGRITRGWLGVQIQEITPDLAKGLGLPKVEGVLVADMTEGSPAAKSGFHQGDVILSFDGHAIQRLHDLPLLVAEAPLGHKAEVAVWRRGRAVTLWPVIEEMPETPSVASKDQGGERHPQVEGIASFMGLTLAPLTPEWRLWFNVSSKIKGVLVLSVADDSPFVDLDIARGDVMVTIDQQPVSTPQDAMAKLRAAAARDDGSVLLLINRNGTSRFAALPMSHGAVGNNTGKRR